MRPHHQTLVPLAALAILFASSCSRGGHVTPAAVEVRVAAVQGELPSDPLDARWTNAGEFEAPLILQDMVEPRLLEPSTRAVKVRALSDGTRVAFRLEWLDDSKNEMALPAQFVDACAVQLPARTAPDVPAPQMGEPGRPVEITLWRASWQAWVDGRPDAIQALHEHALPDHYPFQAASLAAGSEEQRAMQQRYAPASALGNRLEGPRERAVQDLVAEGPGTLAPAASTQSSGSGKRTSAGWSVVITRKLPAGLAPGQRTQVAFAVWQGAHEEVGARKMRTGWTPLLLEAKP